MSEIQVVGITSRTEKTYTVKLEGCESRPMRYSRTAKHYRPDLLTVVKRDGNVAAVRLRGPLVKSNGQDGMNVHEESLRRQGEWPDWLLPIIKGLA